MTAKSPRSWKLLVLCALVGACGSSGGEGKPDTGVKADTGTTVDTGSQVDTGSPADTGGQTDTGTTTDTGTDRGSSADTGADTRADAGTGTDTRADAGADTGAPNDAATDRGGDTTTAASPCPPAPANCRVMPLGDSITDGYTVPGGYRIPLFTRAATAGQHLTFVGSANPPNGPTNLVVNGMTFPRAHEGHSGFTIDPDQRDGRDGISPLTAASLMANTPHVVLLMIGTNDMNLNNAVTTAPTRLGALLDLIFQTSPNVTVILAQITPTKLPAVNTRIMAYNAAMPALVTARANAGRRIFLVDMYAALNAADNTMNPRLQDDLHPNTAGYQAMGDTWYTVLGPMLH